MSRRGQRNEADWRERGDRAANLGTEGLPRDGALREGYRRDLRRGRDRACGGEHDRRDVGDATDLQATANDLAA